MLPLVYEKTQDSFQIFFCENVSPSVCHFDIRVIIELKNPIRGKRSTGGQPLIAVPGFNATLAFCSAPCCISF